MKVDVIISADDIKKSKIIDRSAVIIDMLRATSVIITAINNGCSEVIPVIEVEKAIEISKCRKNCVLGGERKAVKIDGFDFGNSPLEYTRNAVLGKTLIMTTTNGTRAINGSIGAKNILMGALINASSTAKKLVELGNDIVIVNAGTAGQFSIDDFICSGYIIDRILNITNANLSDIATTALHVYRTNPDIISFIKYAKHYNIIKNLGLQDDLKYCCKKDIIDIVPEFAYGKITGIM